MSAHPLARHDVALVRAENPGPFTLEGTNTWVVGRDPAWVVDPGPDLSEHVAAVAAEVAGRGGLGGIALTHSHADHTAALEPLLVAAGPAPVAAMDPDAVAGRGTAAGRGGGGAGASAGAGTAAGWGGGGAGASAGAGTAAGWGGGGAGASAGAGTAAGRGVGRSEGDVTVFRLSDGERFGPFVAVATPGHAPDHVAFVAGRVCFTGDAVLGRGSVFVAPAPGALAGYLDALRRLRALDLELLCPGHGPVVTDPAGKLDEYVAHRLDRERRLIAALDAGLRTQDELLDEVWDDAPPALRPAAATTLRCHLGKLAEEGRLPAGVLVDPAVGELPEV